MLCDESVCKSMMMMRSSELLPLIVTLHHALFLLSSETIEIILNVSGQAIVMGVRTEATLKFIGAMMMMTV